ncbi:regulator of G protein signaling family member locomotion defects isoform X1 [Bombus vancouverensis nearcticus]|uniref:regulator of G protein signaling family member locomotion defects isoform X1 n=1 Tax=Bombus vancouverensis nearcticus TaxID=2705178 RepID=UPI0014388AC9|nr:regulator of G-protein signaling loco isoform X2 [Bombus vancouverensis nearcticus]
MHQNRKKKKRVNYGVRAVEVLRGMKGFGFTISGQQPCILSCIVPGSPADIAGLRAGDYLVSVNGHNVSKLPHDDVVQLIGRSKGILKLQIAENYYSDSSDEEGVTAVRCKPKYIHKPRASNMGALQLQCRVAKVVRDLQSGAMFDVAGKTPPELQNHGTYCNLHYHWDMSSPLPPPPPPASHKRDSEKIVHRTVVGYLGTIDIPNQLHPSCMMQVLRKCIKRLKAEKRNPTTVLLTIHVANIKLTNSENRVIAEYPSYRIIFCNSFSEQDKQYFGILTKSVKDKENIVSNSCHVFTIYYKLIDHIVHSSVCNIFGFTCTKTSELNVCQEFPDSCNGLIGAIQTLYISDSTATDTNPYNEMRRHQETASPQPSNISTSTAHSSNSDSGIGYKDDCTSRSDKNIVQNIPRRRCPTLEYRDACEYSSRSYGNEAVDLRLTVRAVSKTCWNETNKLSKDSLELPRESVMFNDFCNGISTCSKAIENSDMNSDIQKGTKRGDLPTCPLPSASTVKQGLLSSSVGSLVSVCTTAMLHGLKDPVETPGDAAIKSQSELLALTRLAESKEIDVPDKFSPKVFSGISKSLVHSFEDLNTSMDYVRPLCQTYSDKSDNSRPWGSLQEIRNVGTCAQNICLHGSTQLCDKNTDCKNIHAWANGFEKLLEDPKGLQTFAEFLKKEFSHENIYFWAACERYKDTKDVTTRRKLANQIYQRHLSTTAAEPVNVDSHATGQITQELLSEAPADLFLQAQKQVFNLMKFDSYPRFLRSDLYRRCVETGNSITGVEDCDLNLTSSPSVKLKKSHSDAEDRCRKSILPWNRKNRSKSKDRGESEYNKGPNRNETIYKSFTTMKREAEGNNNDDSISISSSRSSLASWDLALRQSFHKHSLSSYEGQSNETKEVRAKCTGLCRVILPDGSTTVVPTSQMESIKDVVTRLLDKRALRYSNYDVLILATDETIDTKYPSSVLAGQEVEVVPTKILKVDLPSRRVITVIAHKGRTLKDVLRPLLNKYGFNLETITVWSENHRVCTDVQAIDAPARLILTNIKDQDPQKELTTVKYTHDGSNSQSTLDEITNRVFEELLVGKGASKYHYNDGSCKSDDQRSEGSSILPSKFFLRDSTMHGKKKGGKPKCNMNEKSNANDYVSEETAKSHPPLIAKWRNGVKLQLPGKFDGEDLYEGLKRAQRSRLEDQRGTEINFELPDFLKNKENGKPTDRNKVRRPRIISTNCEANAKFYSSIHERQNCGGHDQNTTTTATPITTTSTATTTLASAKNGDLDKRFHVLATGKELQSKSSDSSFILDTTLTDGDRTVVENGSCSRNTALDSFDTQVNSLSVMKSSKPPPLPPKPKNLVTCATKSGYIMSSKSLPKSNCAVSLSPTEFTRKNIL